MNNKIVRLILITTFIFAALAAFTACNNREEAQQPMVNMDKFWYANHLGFEFRIVINGEVFSASTLVNSRIRPGSDRFDPFYDEFVLVHNEEQAAGFPDNVIVAWPREGNVEGLIAGIHFAVGRDENDLRGIVGQRRPVINSLEDFGLSYPMQPSDLVDNWEKVNALWQTFDGPEQNFILGNAPHGGPLTDEGNTND